MQFKFIDAIFNAGGEVYLVGGNVRDRLLNLPHKDNDLLITKVEFQTLMDLLKKEGWVNTVGKSFGIIKFRPKGSHDVEFDLSLPRVEKSTGPKHRDFEVDFDPNIPVEVDLGRRDFTLNAMAFHLKTQVLVDPFGGKKDLEAKILRQVFANTFVEDPLRLLRAVQFSARFNLAIEAETLEGMRKNAPLLSEVSKERVMGEIKKLFMAEKPSQGINIMRETGLLEHVFPFIPPMIGVMQPMKKNEDVYDHTMKVLDASRSAVELEKPGDIDLMFSALFHDAGKPATVAYDADKDKTTFYGHQIVSKRIAKQWLNEYKATCIGVNIAKVLSLVFNHMFETKAFYGDRAIRRFVNKIGKDYIFDLIDLRIADKKGGRFPDSMKGILNLRDKIQEELDKKPPFGPKDLALNGHDIMAMGYPPGPIIGEIQKFLVEKTLDEPELNVKETLEKLVREKFPA